MPKHPPFPPFKTSIVRSGNKDTKKHMITIPKPVMKSNWASWGIKKTGDGMLTWYPTEYESIIKLLERRWPEAFEEAFNQRGPEYVIFICVVYNPELPLDNTKAWTLEVFRKPKDQNFDLGNSRYRAEKDGQGFTLVPKPPSDSSSPIDVIPFPFELISQDFERIEEKDPTQEIKKFADLDNLSIMHSHAIREFLRWSVWRILTIF